MSQPILIEVTAAGLQSPSRALLDRVIEASRSGRQVRLSLEGTTLDYAPRELAEILGCPEILEDDEAALRRRRESAEARVLEAALRVQDRPTKAKRLVSVGRHPKTGILAALYAVDGGSKYETEFVAPSGDVKKQAINP